MSCPDTSEKGRGPVPWGVVFVSWWMNLEFQQLSSRCYIQPRSNKRLGRAESGVYPSRLSDVCLANRPIHSGPS